eukprot:SAG11_NODE_461_length_9234_cov_10.929611_6_plen_90_part_00
MSLAGAPERTHVWSGAGTPPEGDGHEDNTLSDGPENSLDCAVEIRAPIGYIVALHISEVPLDPHTPPIRHAIVLYYIPQKMCNLDAAPR